MNTETAFFTPQRLRVLFTALSLYAALLCIYQFYSMTVVHVQSNDECIWSESRVNGQPRIVIHDVIRGGVADKAGLLENDTLLAIDGINLTSAAQAGRVLDSIPNGGSARYTVKRGGTVFECSIVVFKQFNLIGAAFVLLAFSFTVIGYVVGMTKPTERVPRLFYLMSLGAGLFFTLLGDPTGNGIFRFVNILVGTTLFVALFVRFFFFFPVEQPFVKRSRFLAALPVIFIVLLNSIVVLQVLLKVTVFTQIVYLYFLSLPAGLLFFILGIRMIRTPQDRKPLHAILWGVSIGILAIGFLLIIVNLYPSSVLMSPVFMSPVIGMVAIPLSFAYSIFRYRVMDVTIVVKKSLLYAMITAVIAALYFAIVLGIGRLLVILLHVEGGNAVTAVAIVIIAFVFDPLKERIQEFVNRRFFREQYDYQKTLLTFSQELPRKIDTDEIVGLLVDRIASTMHINAIALCVFENESTSCSVKVHQGLSAECCTFSLAPDGLVEVLKRLRTPQLHYRLKEENSLNLPEEERRRLIGGGIVLTIPLMVQDRLAGILHLGPKKSERPYSEEDLDLLEVVSSQAAVALENARLHLEDAKRRLLEEELTIARNIQEGLLPAKNPVVKGLDVSGIMIPARTVGGDYFDFIELDQNRFLVVVGDVAGKGMSAALYMSKIQGMIQLASRIYSSPKDILVEVNRRIYEGISRKSFITMTVALFDLKHRRVRICRAGHPQPLVVIGSKNVPMKAKGIGLGLEEGKVFKKELQEVSGPLARHSTYLFYSDGVTEAMNMHLEEFGEQRLAKIFERASKKTAQEIQDTLLREIAKFRGDAEQNDDITVVAVKTV